MNTQFFKRPIQKSGGPIGLVWLLLLSLSVGQVACWHSGSATDSATDSAADSADTPSTPDTNAHDTEDEGDTAQTVNDSDSGTHHDSSVDSEHATDMDSDTDRIHDSASAETIEGCFPQATVTLKTSEDVAALAPYSCVEVSLIITGATIDEMDLPNLKQVGSDLIIQDTVLLSDLNGLSALESVGTHLFIRNNERLVSLQGLEGISEVTNLILENNAMLKDLDGLSGMTSASRLDISENDALAQLDGLLHLDTLSSYLTINDNPQLIDIEGLSNLAHVENASFHIYGNSQLGRCRICDLKQQLNNAPRIEAYQNMDDGCFSSCELEITDGGCIASDVTVQDAADMAQIAPYSCIEGSLTLRAPLLEQLQLPNLESISGSLLILDAQNLLNLSGLESLRKIGSVLAVNNAPLLTDLRGLDNVQSLSGIGISDNATLSTLNGLTQIRELESVWIVNNPALTALMLDSLERVDGGVTITDNRLLPQCDALDIAEKMSPKELDELWTLCIENNETEADTETVQCRDNCHIYLEG